MADDLPAPDSPEITTRSRSRDARAPSTEASLTAFATSAPSPVEVRVEVAGHLLGEPGHVLQILPRGGEDGLRRAEVLEQQPLARRPDAGQLVHDRLGHRPVAAAPVVSDGEAVRLVADALEQLQLGRVVRPHDRHGVAWAG